MPFEKSLPEWNKEGTEPPQSLKDSGWAANQKPPADYFNWFFYTVFNALKELQEEAINTDQKGVANGVATLDSNGSLPIVQADSILNWIKGFGLGDVSKDISGTDLNNLDATGFYRGNNLTNAPSSSWYFIINEKHLSTYKSQIAISFTGTVNQVFVRTNSNGSWTSWKQLATTDLVTTSANGLMSATDKVKLDGITLGNSAGNALKLDGNALVPLANIPSTLTGKDADTVDGSHAGTGANNVLKLDGNGKVPVGNLPAATTSAQGSVQLSDSTSDTSTSKAATANAVKTTYDRAVSAENNAKTYSDNNLSAHAGSTTAHANASQSVNGFMSASDKAKLDGIAAGAEVNQNAFANIKVGSTTVAADSKTDTLELANGTGITLTPDATNDKVTIAVDSTIETTAGSQTKANTAENNAKSYADGKFLPITSYTASDVLAKLKTVDGSGSGLDADLLDGHDSNYFLPASAYSASDVLSKLKSMDGSGSGVDADLLDGHDSNYFAPAIVAQLLKITNDNGSPTIGISDTSQDFLAAIVAKGVGMNTFYCTGGAVNAPSKSIRGISFITDTSPRGFVIGIDYTGVMWTNYTDPNSGWTGWRTIADNTVAQMMKITSDNGGVTVSIPDTNTDLLATLSSAGTGMHTFYCPAGGLNNPAKNSPVRGIAHFTNGTATSASIGWVIAIDTSGNMYTNYLLSAGNWSGWIRSLSTADQSATWYNLPLSNGAQAWSSDVVPQYCKVGGVVYLRGAITNVSSTGLVLGTLPAGYRPSKTWNFIQNTSQKGGFGNSARWAIGADGTITLEYVSSDVLGSSVWLPLFTDFPTW
ncbi:tail fiber protein [Heyndrickxia ginsengihumi]|uniref:tail fiber protein n=1 Tax=Heyndrickxia ginsengihumi TaxID=363870 RepID=UPI0004704C04|nr:tail fiber protein [Heyndrickxia ginsengihumi]